MLNLKICLKKWGGEFKKTEIVLIGVHMEIDRTLAHSGDPGDLVTRMGDRENFVLYPGDSRIIQESWHV